jgi:hypothetical protein
VIDTNSLIDFVMDVNHPDFVVTSVEVLDHSRVIELIPTSTRWALSGVTGSSTGISAIKTEDLSILTNGDVRPGSFINKDWLEVTFWSRKILGVSLVIQISISTSHPDLSVSTASDFLD